MGPPDRPRFPHTRTSYDQDSIPPARAIPNRTGVQARDLATRDPRYRTSGLPSNKTQHVRLGGESSYGLVVPRHRSYLGDGSRISLRVGVPRSASVEDRASAAELGRLAAATSDPLRRGRNVRAWTQELPSDSGRVPVNPEAKPWVAVIRESARRRTGSLPNRMSHELDGMTASPGSAPVPGASHSGRTGWIVLFNSPIARCSWNVVVLRGSAFPFGCDCTTRVRQRATPAVRSHRRCVARSIDHREGVSG
jgi:hypothetical protein